MRLPLQINFRNVDPSPALESVIREQAAKLERFCQYITSCRVVVEIPHRHQHQGKLYSVRIDMTVPQGELAVDRQHPLDHTHEDAAVAVHDAFDAARRILQEHVQRARGDVKRHSQPVGIAAAQ